MTASKASRKDEIINSFVQPQNRIEHYLNEAIDCYKLGHYQEAISFCEKVMHIDMNCSRAYHGKALALMGLKQFQEAILACQKAVELEQNNAKAYITLGEIFFILEQYSESSSAYHQASQIRQGYRVLFEEKLDQLINLGEDFYTKKLYEKASNVYANLLLFNPTNNLAKERLKRIGIFLLIAKGDDFFKMEVFQEAANIYHQVIETDGTYLPSYTSKIKLLIDEGDEQCKIECYDKALVAYENALAFASASPYGRAYFSSFRSKLGIAKGGVLFKKKQYLEMP